MELKQLLYSWHWTMSETDDALRKRRLSEVEDSEQDSHGEERQVKQSRRLSNDALAKERTSRSAASNFIPEVVDTASFLPFHLTILRALYSNDSSTLKKNEQRKEALPPEEDGTVDDRFWELITSYLQQRGGLREMRYESDYFRGVCQEALQVMENDGQRKSADTPPLLAIMGSSHLPTHHHHALLMSANSQQSPHVSRYANPALSSSSQILAETGMTGSLGLHHRRRSFGVVARLLERKSKIAELRLVHQTTPFEPLFQEVERRRKKLRKLLDQCDLAVVKRNQSRTMELLSPVAQSKKSASANRATTDQEFNNNAEESMARLETKFRLWSLLYHDLKGSA
jgi:hypothetical protein